MTSTIRAVVFDWGGTLTPWHDIDLFSQWYAYAEFYDPADASGLAQRLLDAEVRKSPVGYHNLGSFRIHMICDFTTDYRDTPSRRFGFSFSLRCFPFKWNSSGGFVYCLLFRINGRSDQSYRG